MHSPKPNTGQSSGPSQGMRSVLLVLIGHTWPYRVNSSSAGKAKRAGSGSCSSQGKWHLASVLRVKPGSISQASRNRREGMSGMAYGYELWWGSRLGAMLV